MRRTAPANTNIKWDCPTDGCYRDQLPDWSPLNDCFPRAGIRVTDIDGMVEVGGHFLFIEWKPPKVPVPDGQMRALTRLSTLPRITVLIVWGITTLEPEQWQILSKGQVSDPHPVDFITWHSWINAWATVADDEPGPASRCVPPRPQGSGHTGENRVPTLRPGPFRDAGDAGRATPETDPDEATLGTRSGTHPDVA